MPSLRTERVLTLRSFDMPGKTAQVPPKPRGTIPQIGKSLKLGLLLFSTVLQFEAPVKRANAVAASVAA
jgi:hypothetical protein